MLNKDKFVQISLVIAIILLAVLIYISFINKRLLLKNPITLFIFELGIYILVI